MEINCLPVRVIAGPEGAVLDIEFVAKDQLPLGTIGERCYRVRRLLGVYVD